MENNLLLKCLDEFNASIRTLANAFESMSLTLKSQLELETGAEASREKNRVTQNSLIEEAVGYVKAMKEDLERARKERKVFDADPLEFPDELPGC